MVFFQSVFWLLVLIGVMILVHELGHFWAARFFDVRVDAFSFGFGPRLFGFKKGETDYRFSLILFGGYVKMAGEQPGDENANDPRGFLGKPRWQRLIIALAGPFMNVVLAVALLTGLYMVKYPQIVGGTVIGNVTPNSPAAKAGLKEGDKIVSLSGRKDPTWDDVIQTELANAKRPLDLTVDRDGHTFQATVTPVVDERSGLGMAGWIWRGDVQLGPLSPNMPAQKAGFQEGDLILSVDGHPVHSVSQFQEMIRGSNGQELKIQFRRANATRELTVRPVYSDQDGPKRWIIGAGIIPKPDVRNIRLSLPAALEASVRTNKMNAGLIFQVLSGIIERRISPKTLTGPIGIGQMSGQAAKQGPYDFIDLMSGVSLNLAIFNLLPIPILDGGVIVLLLIEMLMRRDLSLSVKEAVFKVGFVFIMMLVAFVLYNDISKILPAG
ncbi:MAG: RIP metalloprotease RseP [Bryobacteraceae bacterium]